MDLHDLSVVDVRQRSFSFKTLFLVLLEWNHRIILFWLGKDLQGSPSPTLKWIAHMGIKPRSLMLLAACSEQLICEHSAAVYEHISPENCWWNTCTLNTDAFGTMKLLYMFHSSCFMCHSASFFTFPKCWKHLVLCSSNIDNEFWVNILKCSLKYSI